MRCIRVSLLVLVCLIAAVWLASGWFTLDFARQRTLPSGAEWGWALRVRHGFVLVARGELPVGFADSLGAEWPLVYRDGLSPDWDWDCTAYTHGSGQGRGVTIVQVSTPILAAPLVAAALWAWWPLIVRPLRRASERAKRGLCAACGYDRRGISTITNCPECGSAAVPMLQKRP
jgi:hypothetical protein